MKSRRSRLGFLFSPFALGVYVTLAFTWISAHYYQSRNGSTDRLSGVESFINLAHQKSIDFRLKQRGERAGSPQVALLTVDERAVETVGRWPWSREVIAQALDQAVQYGAKVIALDVVFSEPSAQPGAEIYKEVIQKAQIPAPLQKLFTAALGKHDSDQALAKILAKDSSYIVQGGFGLQIPPETSQGFSESCHELIYSLSPESKFLAEKQKPLIVIENRPEIPNALKAFYLNQLQQIAELLSEGPPPQSPSEKRELKMKVLDAQIDFCQSWLDPQKDPTFSGLSENWEAVVQTEGPELRTKFPTFQSWVDWFKSQGHSNAIPRTLYWTLNIPGLNKLNDSYMTGFFNATLEADGTIRKANLVLRAGTSANTYLPSIALKAFLSANNYNAKIKLSNRSGRQSDEVETFQVIDEKENPVFDIPVDGSGRMLINFAGRQKIFPHVSLADLLTKSDELTYEIRQYDGDAKVWLEKSINAKKSEFLKDKLFILGATAAGIYDLRVTPFEENYPGAETHANVLDNLIRHDFLVTSPREDLYMPITLFILGLLLAFCLSYFGAIAGLIVTLFLSVSIAVVDKYFFFGHGLIVTVILPLGLILVLFLFLTSYKYFTEERGKKELRDTFQKYVSPAIVDEILSDPSRVELGGRKAKLTIFFSDIRGFTKISEKLDPPSLSQLLNRYLTPMTDLVFQNRGTLDKYMGDAIMAFFGAPLPYQDHAKQACRCALLSLEKLTLLRNEFKREGLPEIDIGIGLNTGDVSVGNMGSVSIRSYTVIGDAVNLASRLEGLNKHYGTHILLSEWTYAEIKDDFTCREIDWVRVHGKEQPVRIYELIKEGNVSVQTQQMLKLFSLGYQNYRQKRWNQAIEDFNQALNQGLEDPVCRLYIRRCQEYQTDPPKENWDGVFQMKTK